MSGGTLYTYRDNFRANKALIAAQYSGAPVKVVSDSPDFVIGETNKSDAFLKKFPLGKVPAFEGKDGTLLFKSNAIAYYLANEQLRGTNLVDAAHVQQWIEFAENDVLPAYCTWLFPCLGILQYNKQNTEKAKEDIKTALNVLNTHLLTRTYLVGERITLADITVVCYLVGLYRMVLDAEFRKPYPNTNRWFNTLVHQPQFIAVLGKSELCEKMAQFDSKKFEELHAKGDKCGAKHHGGEKEKGGAKKEKHENKPADKPHGDAAKPAAVSTAGGDEEEEEFKEDTKDVFAHLPKGSLKAMVYCGTTGSKAYILCCLKPECAAIQWAATLEAHSTFNMDDFKREYSNKDTKTVALPFLWSHFDKENYSIWYAEYKYPEELKMVFMSCNLVTGMYQRLDRMRKHAFGSMIVFGKDNESTLSGIWIWRGQELAFTLSEDLQIDYESYNWTKLDPDSPDTKTKVDEYLAWEGNFNGKKFNQGKIYK